MPEPALEPAKLEDEFPENPSAKLEDEFPENPSVLLQLRIWVQHRHHYCQ